ncbi:hypothetical protein [Ralstonia phage RpY2]|uniref:Uncharacterized protein n=1 Tax=Ralstonia phage RpY2 TaxID=2880950 RepID=A0AC61TND8_9CAUD|nr:hypothetical protein [Ralstonia phage RpY2]
MSEAIVYTGHGPEGGIQEHSKGKLHPLVCVVKEPPADLIDQRKLTYWIDPRKGGKDVTGEWRDPFFALKYAILYSWGYKFDTERPLGVGLELFAAAEGRTVDSLYREAQNISAAEHGRGFV